MNCRAWATRTEVVGLTLSAQGERARLRMGRPVRAPAVASTLRAEVPCAARAPRAAPPLGLAWPVSTCGRCLCSDLDMLAVAPPLRRRRDAPWVAALLGAVHARPSLPTLSLAGTTVARLRVASVSRAKPWVGVRWRDLCGAEERSTRGRARSAHPDLTRRDCSSAASAASFATGHECEHRRGVGPTGRPLHHERHRIPTRGFARSRSRARHGQNQEKPL